MLDAQERGEITVMDFLNQQLLSATQVIFYSIKTWKLKTFSDQVKLKIKAQVAGKDVFRHNDKSLFTKLLVLGESWKNDLREILSYSLGTVFYSLASADSTLAKTKRPALLDLLESKGEDNLIDHVPENGAIIFDRIASIQALRDVPSTSGELAGSILVYMIYLAGNYKNTCLDFVTDQYPHMSIKMWNGHQMVAPNLYKSTDRTRKPPLSGRSFFLMANNMYAWQKLLWKDADLQTVDKDLTLYSP